MVLKIFCFGSPSCVKLNVKFHTSKHWLVLDMTRNVPTPCLHNSWWICFLLWHWLELKGRYQVSTHRACPWAYRVVFQPRILYPPPPLLSLFAFVKLEHTIRVTNNITWNPTENFFIEAAIISLFCLMLQWSSKVISNSPLNLSLFYLYIYTIQQLSIYFFRQTLQQYSLFHSLLYLNILFYSFISFKYYIYFLFFIIISRQITNSHNQILPIHCYRRHHHHHCKSTQSNHHKINFSAQNHHTESNSKVSKLKN